MKRLEDQIQALLQAVSLEEIREAYEKISHHYRSGTPLRIQTELEALAYGAARMPATTAVLGAVLQHLLPWKSLLQSSLDLGCGTGSSLWATHDDFSVKSHILVDSSSLMQRVGRRLQDGLKLSSTINWVQHEVQSYRIKEPADVVTVSYILNELDEDAQQALVKKAWEGARHFLVLVEPGTPQGFQNIKKARAFLIQRGAWVVAPCTHEQACPMQETDWCHFKVRLQRSSLHRSIKGLLPYEDEKYSFVIASKEDRQRRPTHRIVKNPRHSKGMVRLELCSSAGLSEKVTTRKEGEIYKTLRKKNWGEGVSL